MKFSSWMMTLMKIVKFNVWDGAGKVPSFFYLEINYLEVSSVFKVVHVNDTLGDKDVRVFIGRPSVLGNPFRIGRDGSREEVIFKYRRWLWSEIKKQGRVYKELVGLLEFEQQVEEIQLACFCHPLPCHGDVLMKALNWLFFHLYDEEQWGK